MSCVQVANWQIKDRLHCVTLKQLLEKGDLEMAEATIRTASLPHLYLVLCHTTQAELSSLNSVLKSLVKGVCLLDKKLVGLFGVTRLEVCFFRFENISPPQRPMFFAIL